MKYLKLFLEAVNFEETKKPGFTYTLSQIEDDLVYLTDMGFEVNSINQYFNVSGSSGEVHLIEADIAITYIELIKNKSEKEFVPYVNLGGYPTKYVSLNKFDKSVVNIYDHIFNFCNKYKDSYFNITNDINKYILHIEIRTPVVKEDKIKAKEIKAEDKARDLLKDKISFVRRKFYDLMKQTGRSKTYELISKNKLGESMWSYKGNVESGVLYNIYNLEDIKTKKSKESVLSILEDVDIRNNKVFSGFGKSEIVVIDQSHIQKLNKLVGGENIKYFEDRYLGCHAIVTIFDYEKLFKDLKKWVTKK